MHGVHAGFRLQLHFFRHYPDQLTPLLTAPLYAGIFAMIMNSSGRPDLAGAAALAPFYLTLWGFTLYCGGWIIQTDRWEGTAEYVVSSRAGMTSVILGRICATIPPGILAFAETWLFARYVLREQVAVHHWGLFLISSTLTFFAMAATTLLMAAAFVLARNAATFANSASFPFYVLGGILVPVALLPGWLQPLSKLVFLSWSADLLRAAVDAAPASHQLVGDVMIALLGLASLAAGAALLRWILVRVCRTGELGLR